MTSELHPGSYLQMRKHSVFNGMFASTAYEVSHVFMTEAELGLPGLR